MAEIDSAEVRRISDKVSELVDADADRLKEIFKDIHKHPELGFMETVGAAGL